MKLLALETANEQCSVCITHDSKVVFHGLNEQTRAQTQTLLPMIEQGLKQTHFEIETLDAIAFSRGPGSFSGVRINAAVTQALAWAHDLHVIPVSTLQALAQTAYRQHGLTAVTAVLDARMSEVYIANFKLDDNKIMCLQGDEQLLSYENAKQVVQFVCVGSGANLVSESELSQLFATAEDIAFIAYNDAQHKKWVSAEDALPVYLRDNAWKKIAEQGKA